MNLRGPEFTIGPTLACSLFSSPAGSNALGPRRRPNTSYCPEGVGPRLSSSLSRGLAIKQLGQSARTAPANGTTLSTDETAIHRLVLSYGNASARTPQPLPVRYPAEKLPPVLDSEWWLLPTSGVIADPGKVQTCYQGSSKPC